MKICFISKGILSTKRKNKSTKKSMTLYPRKMQIRKYLLPSLFYSYIKRTFLKKLPFPKSWPFIFRCLASNKEFNPLEMATTTKMTSKLFPTFLLRSQNIYFICKILLITHIFEPPLIDEVISTPISNYWNINEASHLLPKHYSKTILKTRNFQ